MTERRRFRRPRLPLAVVAALALACAPAASPPRGAPSTPPPPPPPRPAPADEAQLDAFAELIRLEDRRDFDAASLARHAGAASPRVRARAALTLGRLRNSEGAPLLFRLLADPDTAVAATAAFALGQFGDSVYTPALAAQLGDSILTDRPTVVSEAAYALGKTRGTEARDALIALLARRPLVDSTGAGAIGSALLAIWKLPAPPDIAPVARWLDAADAELRWRSAYALTRRPDVRAVPLLRHALADADPRVRSLALRGLSAALADSAGIAREELLAEISPLIRDPEYVVSISAARTLGGYSQPRAVEELASAAAAPEAHLAITALESLARIGPPARSVAQAIASQARADSLPIAVRSAALDAIARIDSATAFEVAGELAAASAWRLRAAAARAFALLERPAGPRFDRLIRDPDPRVVNAALQAAIDEAGDSVAPLRPLLVAQLATGDAIVRSTALTALARIADPSLLPPLLDAYDRAQRDTLNDAALAAVAAIGAVAREGTHPARAFFARFPRSADALVRSRVAESFDSTAVAAAWGAALPVDTERSPAEYRALVDELVAPVLAGGAAPAVAVETEGGTIVLRLFPLEATLTVESFLTLARTGYFDGQEWPRVVGNFVVQGGDPRGDTSGGPGYTIRDEINRHRYGVGTLGMALAGRDTGGSQFFVTHSPQPHLDGIYAVFGEVETGQELTERILPAHTIDRIRRLP